MSAPAEAFGGGPAAWPGAVRSAGGLTPVGLIDLALAARGAGPARRARLMAGALGVSAAVTLGDLTRQAWALRADLAAIRGDGALAPMPVLAHCPECQAALEFDLPADLALPAAGPGPDRVRHLGRDYSLRLPKLEDLGPSGIDPRRLSDPGAPWSEAEFRAAAEAELTRAEPVLTLSVALTCPDCGAAHDHPLDPLVFVWDDIDRSAGRLLAEVATLARAFGWDELQVLALPPARRAAYLAEVAR